MTIEEMLEALGHFPRNSRCIAKEKQGEVPAVEIRSPEREETLGYIPTSESSSPGVDTNDVVF